ncbi:hypothetical protein PBI_SHEPARD_80 [Arthrobacter phage Shepard]|nr:hypothetical protein PBI_SHEPARD_80 [Arthrobacter phage Shepard]UYL88268.1 hypothetical protein SEA_LILHUDDY_79 [Arthrobacter phage LilHuddy]
MNEYFTTRDQEQAMAKEMCKRVELSELVGSFILAMCRIKSHRLGNQVNMVVVAQLIKFASEHKGDLKRQFHRGESYTQPSQPATKPGKYTFLK